MSRTIDAEQPTGVTRQRPGRRRRGGGGKPGRRGPGGGRCRRPSYQAFPSGERADVTEQFVPDLGGYVSTTADVNRFLQGLLGGRLLPPARLAEMQDTVPVDRRVEAFWPDGRYGLGPVSRPLTCGGSHWSHEGGEAGHLTPNGATADGGRAVTVSLSTTSSEPGGRTPRASRRPPHFPEHFLNRSVEYGRRPA